MRALLLPAVLLAALADSAPAETWCLKSEWQAGPDAPVTRYFWHRSNCPKSRETRSDARADAGQIDGDDGRDPCQNGLRCMIRD